MCPLTPLLYPFLTTNASCFGEIPSVREKAVSVFSVPIVWCWIQRIITVRLYTRVSKNEVMVHLCTCTTWLLVAFPISKLEAISCYKITHLWPLAAIRSHTHTYSLLQHFSAALTIPSYSTSRQHWLFPPTALLGSTDYSLLQHCSAALTIPSYNTARQHWLYPPTTLLGSTDYSLLQHCSAALTIPSYSTARQHWLYPPTTLLGSTDYSLLQHCSAALTIPPTALLGSTDYSSYNTARQHWLYPPTALLGSTNYSSCNTARQHWLYPPTALLGSTDYSSYNTARQHWLFLLQHCSAALTIPPTTLLGSTDYTLLQHCSAALTIPSYNTDSSNWSQLQVHYLFIYSSGKESESSPGEVFNGNVCIAWEGVCLCGCVLIRC